MAINVQVINRGLLTTCNSGTASIIKWANDNLHSKKGTRSWMTGHITQCPLATNMLLTWKEHLASLLRQLQAEIEVPLRTALHKPPSLSKRREMAFSREKPIQKLKRRWEESDVKRAEVSGSVYTITVNAMQKEPWVGWASGTDFEDRGWAFACRKSLIQCSLFLDFGKSMYFHQR